jgi:hypothetical protein
MKTVVTGDGHEEYYMGGRRITIFLLSTSRDKRCEVSLITIVNSIWIKVLFQ